MPKVKWKQIASPDHGTNMGGLGDDDHTQYALLLGRSGGQTLIGGTASGNDLTLCSTSNATKGSIFFGANSEFKEATDFLGLGVTGDDIWGNLVLRKNGALNFGIDTTDDSQYTQMWFSTYNTSSEEFEGSWSIGAYGSDAAANPGEFYIYHYANNSGTIVDTIALLIDVDGKVGIGTTDPTQQLDVNADSIRIRTSQSPASNGTGTQGEIAWDADYIYVCTATDTWKRAALTGGY